MAGTKSTSPSKRTPKRKPTTPKKRTKKSRPTSESDEASDSSDVYEEDDRAEESDAESINSDNLDDEDVGVGKKRKSVGKIRVRPKKKRGKRADDEDELQEVVGKVVDAPTTGHVPPGEISRNTLRFLKDLMRPECNDREWFKLHEPAYRLAEKEWKAFIDTFTEKMVEIDDEIPPLPAKDVIHRIYRDMRFSNDKTPYKTNFSASFSRSGRKGIFAGYHVSVSPMGGSLVAAGLWCPAKNETATIRSSILRNPQRLRQVIENKEFVKLFGPAVPHPGGDRQNIFGHEDQLKVAPKGIDKNHRDIDLLKLRSIAVVHRFLDSEVLEPNFMESVCSVMRVMQPLVHALNDMMTLPADEEEEEEEEEEEASS